MISVAQDRLCSDERWHTKDIGDAMKRLADSMELAKLPAGKGFVCTEDKDAAQPLQAHEVRYRAILRYIEAQPVERPVVSKEAIAKHFPNNTKLVSDLLRLSTEKADTSARLVYIEPYAEGLTAFAKSSKWYALASNKSAAVAALKAGKEEEVHTFEDQIMAELEVAGCTPINETLLLEKVDLRVNVPDGATRSERQRHKKLLHSALKNLQDSSLVYRFDKGGFVLAQHQGEAVMRSRPAHEQRRASILTFVQGKADLPVSFEDMRTEISNRGDSFASVNHSQLSRDIKELKLKDQLAEVSGKRRERYFVAKEYEAAGVENFHVQLQLAQRKTQEKVREFDQRRGDIVQFLLASNSTAKSLDEIRQNVLEQMRSSGTLATEPNPDELRLLRLRIHSDLRKMLKEVSPQIVAFGPEKSPNRRYAHSNFDKAAANRMEEDRQQNRKKIKGVRLSTEQVGCLWLRICVHCYMGLVCFCALVNFRYRRQA